MKVRQKYKISEIQSEIENFQSLIKNNSFDQAVAYFRANLDQPTLFGLETSLKRAQLLQQIEVDKVSNYDDKCFILYSLALTLNLTGGYPNRALPLYQKHDRLAQSNGEVKWLSQSLGHHAKALRQVGRFREAEATARKGLKIIRQRRDFLREAVNLYWLGMGFAHRGDSEKSEIALLRSLRIFKAKFSDQAEAVVHAFLAQRALWMGNVAEAFHSSNNAFEMAKKLENDEHHADLHGAVKILTAAARMKGESLVLAGDLDEGEYFLDYALRYARETEFVEEELPALRALALKALQFNDLEMARDYLKQTWQLAERGRFLLYNADSYNILGRIEQTAGQPKKAIEAAQKAFNLSICDGFPYAYQRGLEDAQTLLNQLEAVIPNLPNCDETKFEKMIEIEINPNDEFSF